ncbi:uncharacterized protein BDZ99DRAFT_462061 [Mytilinidion resinicola]|uniref:Methyltransferase n=1 Tax=Mytilinidion resinicola TaxID=574789 RepID=A0A6A6YP94_9PEZI|nr:uncharacterized protein BDZ99DRAFT_462061 [Mytilinidion resinicola]KAF2810716.1 hypothetical protein BDZ99DRAFT_462061 [Mytilinidion resinicola]
MQDVLKFLCKLPLYESVQPYDLYGYPEQQAETQSNCQFEAKPVSTRDIRELGNTTIETHGFTYFHHESKCDLNSKHFEEVKADKTVVQEYLYETIDMVRKKLDAVDVICFDWRFRRRDPKVAGKIPPRDINNIRSWALPSGDVTHCDYSAVGGQDRLRMILLPEELEKMHTNNHFASIYNVWRPLNKVVKNTPLLFCDKRTIQKTDLIEVDKVLQDKVEKSYFLFHRDYHKWYYLANQRSDEVFLFPTWTSKSDGGEHADCSPHGAGASQTDQWKDPRESVEVRMIVIQSNSHAE